LTRKKNDNDDESDFRLVIYSMADHGVIGVGWYIRKTDEGMMSFSMSIFFIFIFRWT